jgi:NADPH-dependent ferric siderophore reductase
MMDDIINQSTDRRVDETPMRSSSSPRRIERVRFELRRRAVRVARVDRPTPGFARVVFAGDDLADFRSLSFDDHVKFMLPQDDGQPLMRDYTPRRFDAARRELTIEFALHGHGPASEWARQAVPGRTAVIGGPRGSMIVPMDYDWHLLAGDASALPAIARRLEELPAGVRARVLVEMPDAADRRPLPSAAELQVQWVAGGEAWLEALRAQPLPDGEGFAWCAGEARRMAQARDVLLEHHRHPREAMRVAAYWKHGAADFHERLD